MCAITSIQLLGSCGWRKQFFGSIANGMLQGTEDHLMITAESVADGERQGTIDILWRIFLHLQVSFV